MKKFQKGFAHILLVLLVIVGALLLIAPIPSYKHPACISESFCKPGKWEFRSSLANQLITKVTNSPTITNSPDPSSLTSEISDWKTYTNEEYGFEFRYPNNWYVTPPYYETGSDTIRNLGTRITNYTIEPNYGGGKPEPNQYEISIKFLEGEDLFPSPEEHLQRLVESPKQKRDRLEEFQVTDTQINGLHAKKILQVDKGVEGLINTPDIRIDTYFIRGENLWYLHGITSVDSNREEFLKYYDQFISTFEFIEPSEVSTKEGEFMDGVDQFSCQTDSDCIKQSTCSEDCVNTNWLKENPYTGPACGIPWQESCKCINNTCTSSDL